MTDLAIVPSGAVLIRNGIIEEVGPARRVENLAGARDATEIDATGRIVMPAFIDADVTLAPADASAADEYRSLRLMSRQRLQHRVAAMAADWARYGCVTVGASTPCTPDMRIVDKVLRAWRALGQRALRTRPIFSPAPQTEALISKWLPVIFRKKMAAVLELRVEECRGPLMRDIAIAAAGVGYAIRLRSAAPPGLADLQFAASAGAIAIVAPNDAAMAWHGPLASLGCVRVIPATEAFDNPARAALDMRKAIDEGAAIALASTYRTRETSSFNMQFLLHLACDRLAMTAEEAIMATTWNAACSLRLSHVTGSLEPGKSADLLLMEVPDYRDLPRRAGHHDASLVMRSGNVIFRSASLIPD